MLDNILIQAVKKLINHSGSKNKIETLRKKHSKKLHFIPIKYRIFGGILQSMNIQFGNFIEELMQILVSKSGYEILNISGKKNNQFLISKVIEAKIDNYISKAQSDDSFKLNEEFLKLQDEIISDKSKNFITIKHDIDLIFKDDNGIIYYIEIKYNDDHDTGKFIDINRKFIKTYAYLVREFNISSKDKLIPILFYFNNKKMKGNIYIPEETNIYRGKKFFEKFLDVSYEEIEEKLLNFSNSQENIEIFNRLYSSIVLNNQ